MQIILADAKIMREGFEGQVPSASIPLFETVASDIASEMAELSVDVIVRLFHCSRSIAMENQQRFKSFKGGNRTPALFAFYGQAYKYLHADSLSEKDLAFAQDHVSIMSFLYGLIRPLDAISLYRMPADVKLHFTDGAPLRSWWRSRLTDLLVSKVKADDGILLDLATTEFERMLDWKSVEQAVRVIKPMFLVDKGLEYKSVAMYAKGCRGAMARFVIKNRLSSPDDLNGFTTDGFVFRADLGDASHPHFIKSR